MLRPLALGVCLVLASGCALSRPPRRAIEKDQLEQRFVEVRMQLDRWCAAGDLDAIACTEYRRRLLDLALVVLIESLDADVLTGLAPWVGPKR